jgi:uncharacterized delta-60 repeat protein
MMKLQGRLARRTGVRRRHYYHLTFLLVLIVSAALLTGVAVWAADGDLDPTFDGDGIVTTSINDFDQGNDLAIQSDGKIVVVGKTLKVPPAGAPTDSGLDAPIFDFAVTRYNPDGSLDATFGSGGKVTTSLGTVVPLMVLQFSRMARSLSRATFRLAVPMKLQWSVTTRTAHLILRLAAAVSC